VPGALSLPRTLLDRSFHLELTYGFIFCSFSSCISARNNEIDRFFVPLLLCCNFHKTMTACQEATRNCSSSNEPGFACRPGDSTKHNETGFSSSGRDDILRKQARRARYYSNRICIFVHTCMLATPLLIAPYLISILFNS